MGLNINGYNLNTILRIYDEYYSKYLIIPRYHACYNNIPIGKLYRRLTLILKNGVLNEDGTFTYKNVILTKNEYQELVKRSIGSNYDNSTWEEKFEILKEYYEKYNRYPRIYEEYKGVKIGIWVINQRMIYNNGELLEDGSIKFKSNLLTKKRIDTLNEFGFAWSNFDMYLDLLLDYIKEYNEYPKYNTIYKEENLGSWVSKLRIIKRLGILQEDGSILYKTNRLTKKEIDKLDKINFIWNVEKKEPVFDKNFEILKEYYKKDLDCKVYKGLNIKTWSSQLRTTLNRGEEIEDNVYQYKHNSPLKFEDAKKLESINFEFVTTRKYYTEPINSSNDMSKKKRYLLLKLEKLLYEERKFDSKSDINKINEEFMNMVYKRKK